jgi:hypothetical protein
MHPTKVVDIFNTMVEAARQGVQMTPRSANDKEYFAQDWFADRLEAMSLRYHQQGRNSYPDFIVDTTPSEGYEGKSLAFTGTRPARRDIDFNSTIPSGRKDGRDVFLVFFLYTGSGAGPRTVHSLSVAHADLINSDHALADEHLNVQIRRFGSYADGFIRNRKMYVFPHPIQIDPEGLARRRLLVPHSWALRDKPLVRLRAIDRTVAQRAVDRYTIRLHGRGEARVVTTRYANAGAKFQFDVFRLASDT